MRREALECSLFCIGVIVTMGGAIFSTINHNLTWLTVFAIIVLAYAGMLLWMEHVWDARKLKDREGAADAE